MSRYNFESAKMLSGVFIRLSKYVVKTNPNNIKNIHNTPLEIMAV